ncbi:GMC family oxidoreductase N-terminal domain-containing protein [Streptomyces sp. M19]
MDITARDPDPTTSRFLDACVELGLPEVTGGLGGADNTGCAITPLNQRDSSRWSAADGYVRAARERENLRILTGVQVHRVLLRGGRATGSASRTGGSWRPGARWSCAGTVGSPQLLQLSGIGAPEELRRAGIRPLAELPGVGRNLQDHLTLPVTMAATVPLPLVNADTPDNRKLYDTERIGPLTSNITEAVAFFHSDGGIRAPDLELIWAPVAFTDQNPLGAHAFALSIVLLQPHSRGRITLTGPDPASPPAIDPAYLEAGPDLPTFAAGCASASASSRPRRCSRWSRARWRPGPAA